jgi:hypothetical protein
MKKRSIKKAQLQSRYLFLNFHIVSLTSVCIVHLSLYCFVVTFLIFEKSSLKFVYLFLCVFWRILAPDPILMYRLSTSVTKNLASEREDLRRQFQCGSLTARPLPLLLPSSRAAEAYIAETRPRGRNGGRTVRTSQTWSTFSCPYLLASVTLAEYLGSMWHFVVAESQVRDERR